MAKSPLWLVGISALVGAAIVGAGVALVGDAGRGGGQPNGAPQPAAQRTAAAQGAGGGAGPAAKAGEGAGGGKPAGGGGKPTGGGPPGGPGGPRPPQAVTVVTLKTETVTQHATLPGRVVASRLAEVRPQVDGIIMDRMYEEGGRVELGEPLYRIDPATYEARVAAANASVAQAQATYDASLKESDRQVQLQGRGVVSDQTLETAVANRDIRAAALQVAQAQLLQANIDLDRTTIRAPLTGIIGRSLTTQGALVTAGQDTPLATIRTIDPVLVDVTQSAAEIVEFRRGQTQERLANADLTVTLTLADGSEYGATGLLTAAEPYVDEQTGVVTLRLEFPNPDQVLLPGMYAQVALPQARLDNVILAPQEGVTRDRRGRPIAFVVNAQNVVEQRDLLIAEARASDWIVTGGLAAGDRLIVAGLQKIAPGASVMPQERSAEPGAPVEELNAPTAQSRAQREVKEADAGITVPGAGDQAPQAAGTGGPDGAAATGGGAGGATGGRPATAPQEAAATGVPPENDVAASGIRTPAAATRQRGGGGAQAAEAQPARSGTEPATATN